MWMMHCLFDYTNIYLNMMISTVQKRWWYDVETTKDDDVKPLGLAWCCDQVSGVQNPVTAGWKIEWIRVLSMNPMDQFPMHTGCILATETYWFEIVVHTMHNTGLRPTGSKFLFTVHLYHLSSPRSPHVQFHRASPFQKVQSTLTQTRAVSRHIVDLPVHHLSLGLWGHPWHQHHPRWDYNHWWFTSKMFEAARVSAAISRSLSLCDQLHLTSASSLSTKKIKHVGSIVNSPKIKPC